MQTGHAIITGGSSGIGLAVARLLVQQGWNISLIARDADKLRDALTRLSPEKKNNTQSINTYPVDVTDRDGLNDVIQQCVNNNGTPRILITSAGAVMPGYFSEIDTEEFERLMNVNYLGTVYAVKSVMPYMQSEHKGHIVMISSGAGLIGVFGYTAYSPSKFAVRGFAESLRPEAKMKGIHVSIVYPPDTQTPQLVEEEKNKPAETRYITKSGGVMTADDVAASILAGINRKKFTITPGCTMTLLYWLHSVCRPLINYYFDYLASKAREKTGT